MSDANKKSGKKSQHWEDDPVLTLPDSELRFTRCPTGITVEQHWCAGLAGTKDRQIGTIRDKELERLKKWLSAET